VQIAVDGSVHPQLFRHEMYGSNPTGGDGPRPVGDLVVDIRGREHRPLASSVIDLVQPPLDAALALSQFFS
jgi:hypothetical protein